MMTSYMSHVYIMWFKNMFISWPDLSSGSSRQKSTDLVARFSGRCCCHFAWLAGLPSAGKPQERQNVPLTFMVASGEYLDLQRCSTILQPSISSHCSLDSALGIYHNATHRMSIGHERLCLVSCIYKSTQAWAKGDLTICIASYPLEAINHPVSFRPG